MQFKTVIDYYTPSNFTNEDYSVYSQFLKTIEKTKQSLEGFILNHQNELKELILELKQRVIDHPDFLIVPRGSQHNYFPARILVERLDQEQISPLEIMKLINSCIDQLDNTPDASKLLNMLKEFTKILEPITKRVKDFESNLAILNTQLASSNPKSCSRVCLEKSIRCALMKIKEEALSKVEKNDNSARGIRGLCEDLLTNIFDHITLDKFKELTKRFATLQNLNKNSFGAVKLALLEKIMIAHEHNLKICNLPSFDAEVLSSFQGDNPNPSKPTFHNQKQTLFSPSTPKADNKKLLKEKDNGLTFCQMAVLAFIPVVGWAILLAYWIYLCCSSVDDEELAENERRLTT